MFLRTQQRIVSLFLFSCFLRVSSFSLTVNCSLVSWPSIPAGESLISIRNCPNLTAISAPAASGRSDLHTLQLSNNVISQIDGTWIQNSLNIQQIYLDKNKLTSVPAFNCGAAGSEGCPELNYVDLGYNLITIVPARSFANHTKLGTFSLSFNKITTLESLWIVDCPSVKTIGIAWNVKLARFLVSEDSESRGLANLEIVYSHDCNISTLDPDLLLIFPKLKDLHIYGNPIKTLPQFVASHPIKINVASMGNFFCDCSATKLAQNGMIHSANEAGFCGSPDYNVGKSFSQLECRGIESVKEASEELDFLLQQDSDNRLSLTRMRNLLLTTNFNFDIISLQVVGTDLICPKLEMLSMIGNNSCLYLPCRLVSSNHTGCIFSCICAMRPCCLINLSIHPSINSAIHYIRKLLE